MVYGSPGAMSPVFPECRGNSGEGVVAWQRRVAGGGGQVEQVDGIVFTIRNSIILEEVILDCFKSLY